jgi:drug/metabolite transporter (DMT)-like permease
VSRPLPRHPAPFNATTALVVAAALFGVTFVVVKEAVATFPPIGFVAWRFLLGGVLLLVLALPRGAAVWRDGAIAGVALFAGYALQTAGLTLTGASNSALITGLYVVFTPLLVAVVARRAPDPWVFVGTVVGFVGMALLTTGEGIVLGLGDALTLGCAVAFAAHITILAHLARRHPVVPFTAVQLLVTSMLGFAFSVPVEGWQVPGPGVWGAVLLTGIGVSAVAFLLQVWAQTRVGPSRTAMVLGMEPIFGVATAAAVLGERLTPGGWVGAGLILGAVYLVILKEPEPQAVAAEALAPGH